MESKEILGISLSQWVAGILMVVGYLAAALLLRRALFRRVSAWAAQSETRWDDVALHALRLPITLLIFISTALLAGRVVRLPIGWTQVLDQVIRVGTTVAFSDIRGPLPVRCGGTLSEATGFHAPISILCSGDRPGGGAGSR